MQQFEKISQEIACQIMTFYDAETELANGIPYIFSYLSHFGDSDEEHRQVMSKPCEAYPWFQQLQQGPGQQPYHLQGGLHHQLQIAYKHRYLHEGVQIVVYLRQK
jgi:hypothetical protein